MYSTISVLGGDLRQLTVAQLLSNDGYNVKVYGFKDMYLSSEYKVSADIYDALNTDVVILPIPVTLDGKSLNCPLGNKEILLSDISDNVNKKTLILGGRITDSIFDLFYNNKCIDYSKREEMMIKNAVPTAEGAIGIAIEETPVTLYKSNCLVIGYGRIGKVLSKNLNDIGALVTVSARKYTDLAWIEVNGLRAVHNRDLKNLVSDFDLIFNTAPALILNEEVLNNINRECVIIDLASKPGGVDFTKAKDMGLKVIWALSLPGKCAPLTSGKIIKDTVTNILSYEEV